MLKKNKKEERASLTERIYEKFGITADPIYGCSVEITGRTEACICGCKDIGEFTPELIRLKMNGYDLIIEGRALQLPAYGGGKIVISGIIQSIKYDE